MNKNFIAYVFLIIFFFIIAAVSLTVVLASSKKDNEKVLSVIAGVYKGANHVER